MLTTLYESKESIWSRWSNWPQPKNFSQIQVSVSPRRTSKWSWLSTNASRGTNHLGLAGLWSYRCRSCSVEQACLCRDNHAPLFGTRVSISTLLRPWQALETMHWWGQGASVVPTLGLNSWPFQGTLCEQDLDWNHLPFCSLASSFCLNGRRSFTTSILPFPKIMLI